MGYAKSGQGFPDAEQGGTRGIPFYKVSDMNITGNENELITANNYVTQEQINRNHWNVINDVPAVFFAKVGAAVMLNRKRLCRNSFLLDNNTMAYMFDKSKWNYNFGKTMFDTIDLTLLAQVGAIPSYNASDVENIEILMPHLKEQGKIGELFTSLDNLITLHQRKWICIFYSWEQRKFENIFNYERPDKYIVNSTEYLEFGPTPVLTANKAFILGYTTENNKYINSNESIIFDDFTLDAKFVDFPYMVKSSAIKILTLKEEKKDNIRFNFELLSNHRFNMLGHARHYISVVQPEEVFTTKKQEQEKIGQLFRQIDNLITLHQH